MKKKFVLIPILFILILLLSGCTNVEIPPAQESKDFTIRQGVWLGASGIQAPGTKPATLVNVGCDGAWEFADNQEQTISFNIRVPTNINLTQTVVLIIGWTSPSINLNCNWNVTYTITGLHEDVSVPCEYYRDFITNSSQIENGLVTTYFNITEIKQSDKCIHMRIERDGNDATDTLSDVAHLHGICMRYYVDFEKL